MKYKIPVPPLPTQKVIVSKVEEVLKNITNMRKEAKELLEQAKAELEVKILGKIV